MGCVFVWIFFSARSCTIQKKCTFAHGEMAEWSNAVVLKTIVPRGTGGSNPSFSAPFLRRNYIKKNEIKRSLISEKKTRRKSNTGVAQLVE